MSKLNPIVESAWLEFERHGDIRDSADRLLSHVGDLTLRVKALESRLRGIRVEIECQDTSVRAIESYFYSCGALDLLEQAD